MIRADFADAGEVDGLAHLVTEVLPSQLRGTTVSEVMEYVKSVPLGGLRYPPQSKDWFAKGVL